MEEGVGAQVESGRVETNGVQTYYERRGTGPPIVFVHGAILRTTMWEGQMDALSDEFTTVAYDLRGHGQSDGSSDPRYTPATYADDLAGLVDALGFDDPVVCGLSMGGCVAQAFGTRYPDEVAGLVLCDTFAPGKYDLTERLMFGHLRFIGLLDNVVSYKRYNRFQMWAFNLLTPGVAGDEVTIQELVDDGPTMTHGELVKMIEFNASFPHASLDLSRVTAPTLVMHGERLPAGLRAAHRVLAEQLRNARVETAVVPGGGHASNIDTPAFFNDAVRSFARSVHGGDA